MRRQDLGRTLDVGCGIGRNLQHLATGSLGVDHNQAAVAEARRRGLAAVTVDEFAAAPPAELFDSLLAAHLMEHLTVNEGKGVISSYLPFVRAGGKVFFICPQERGYASDSTHVSFLDDRALRQLAEDLGLTVRQSFSFPLPRRLGRAFTYNEFCVQAVTPE